MPANIHLPIRTCHSTSRSTSETCASQSLTEGPGIPHDERDRVFEPYSQLNNPDVPGTGMGLTIVRQIVEVHHGKVWVEDGVGGGTSFAIWLPEAVSNS